MGEDRPDLAAPAAATFGHAVREGVDLGDRGVRAQAGPRHDALEAERGGPRAQEIKDGTHDPTLLASARGVYWTLVQ